MSPVQVAIYRMDHSLNPAGVEAHIRRARLILRAGSTLDHLTHKDLTADTKTASALEAAEPGYLHDLAVSFGLERDHRMWDDITFRLNAAERRGSKSAFTQHNGPKPTQKPTGC